jgi:hypothetical protein
VLLKEQLPRVLSTVFPRNKWVDHKDPFCYNSGTVIDKEYRMKQFFVLVLAMNALTVDASEIRKFSSNDECRATAIVLSDKSEFTPYHLWHSVGQSSPIHGIDTTVLKKNGKVYAFTCMTWWTTEVEIYTEEEYNEKLVQNYKKTLDSERRRKEENKKLLKLLD